VVDVAVGQQDPLDLDAGLGDRLADAVDVAAGVEHGAALGGVVPQDRAVLLERGRRTIAALRPGMLVFTPLVLKPRWDIGRAGTRGNHRGAMSHGHGMADWV
jgi:hypothetical protein